MNRYIAMSVGAAIIALSVVAQARIPCDAANSTREAACESLRATSQWVAAELGSNHEAWAPALHVEYAGQAGAENTGNLRESRLANSSATPAVNVN
jgi:hypothetical protein